MSPPSILGYHSSVGKYRRSNIVKCCMAYIMALFQRSTKFIFCHVKSSLFASPRLGPVLKREDNFIWYLKLARANILKRFSPQRRSNLSPGKSQSCRLSWYCYIIFALLFVRSSVLWLFLHCIYSFFIKIAIEKDAVHCIFLCCIFCCCFFINCVFFVAALSVAVVNVSIILKTFQHSSIF